MKISFLQELIKMICSFMAGIFIANIILLTIYKSSIFELKGYWDITIGSGLLGIIIHYKCFLQKLERNQERMQDQNEDQQLGYDNSYIKHIDLGNKKYTLLVIISFIIVFTLATYKLIKSQIDISGHLFELVLLVLIFIIGTHIREVIRYFIIKCFGYRNVIIGYDKGYYQYFLFSEQHMLVKHARIIWIIPYIFFALLFIISLLFFHPFVALGFGVLTFLSVSNVFIYVNLLKFKKNDTYISNKHTLSFIIKRND